MKSDQHHMITLYALACINVGLVSAESASSQTVKANRLSTRGTMLNQATVPPGFRGHWSVSLGDCGADPIDDSQAWIGASSINFYETNGHIKRVVLKDRNHAYITVLSEGEGRTFVEKKGLALSSDTQTLTITYKVSAGSTTFIRCSAKNTASTFIQHYTTPPR